MPRTDAPSHVEGTGRYAALLDSFLWVSDSDSMSDDAIRAMRRSYAADVSVIDAAVADMVEALRTKDLLEHTLIVYTSDHGEMAGSHGLMSKCVLYEPAVRVPLIIRPPGGCAPLVVDSLVEHVDVAATVRSVAGAPPLPASEGRVLLGSPGGAPPQSPRVVTISENWGFAVFETEHHRLVVDEDALEPCQLFDLKHDPDEDHDVLGDPAAAPVVEELMETHVRPFFVTPPARPIPSLFTGGYD